MRYADVVTADSPNRFLHAWSVQLKDRSPVEEGVPVSLYAHGIKLAKPNDLSSSHLLTLLASVAFVRAD